MNLLQFLYFIKNSNIIYFRVSTCSKATMSNFLRAHEDMGKILFNQMITESTPILNTINRYSGKEI